jgi:hypothetical protein
MALYLPLGRLQAEAGEDGGLRCEPRLNHHRMTPDALTAA